MESLQQFLSIERYLQREQEEPRWADWVDDHSQILLIGTKCGTKVIEMKKKKIRKNQKGTENTG